MKILISILTRRMTTIVNDDGGIVPRSTARISHIAQPSTRLPIRPWLRDIRNVNRIRSCEQLQIQSLLAWALVLVDLYVLETARRYLWAVFPVRRSEIVAGFVVCENGRKRSIGFDGTVHGCGEVRSDVESDRDAYG